MYEEKKNKISPLSVNVWKVTSIIGFNIALVVLSLVIVLFPSKGVFDTIKTLLIVFLFILLVYYIIRLTLLSKMWYRNWNFYLNDNVVILEYGIIYKNKVTIPINRIQYVDIHQGPILKFYKVRTMSIHTAGGKNEIPYLPDSECIDFQSTLIKEVERSREEFGI
ncbi:hypothetical protein CLPU_6c00710 [Gottschalkia purinilytica]|uniref:YdbS-like PH domain-containing protein n=1 Tax=Gottschalkia purinilytica TaxID=1503 RepID=A0A0L0WB81_GOTPU|nr:PH domain-containing protein [Gottschalkia purinilytica]KNF08585.1 hypothetical protein CLPU_6c00710 [Gottschalkia purinilytica]